MSASYSRPFLAHASIGPACAVARVQAGAIEVWCQSQSIHPTRLDIAKTLGVAPDTITVRHVQGAGCYGHNAADDAALDAVLLARAVEGHPVRLQWSHEDELAWSPFGPAMVVAMNGAVDDAGRIVDWRHEVWSNPHIARPGCRKARPCWRRGTWASRSPSRPVSTPCRESSRPASATRCRSTISPISGSC